MRTQGLRLEQAPPIEIPFRFFLSAPLFGALAGLLLLSRGAELLITPLHTPTLAMVHLLTLGCLTMVMLGALYQITPVLLGANVYKVDLATHVHFSLLAGVLCLAGGLAFSVRLLLLMALPLLCLGFLAVAVQFLVTFIRVRNINFTGAAVRLSLASLLMAISLGLTYAGEHALGWLPLNRASMVALHAFLGLGGWVGGLILGVSHAVIPMFYLTRTARPAMSWSSFFLLLAMVLSAPVVLLDGGLGLRLIPPLAGLGAMAVLSAILIMQFRQRKRRITDTSLSYWKVGIASGWISMALLFSLYFLDDARLVFAFGLFYLVGFALAIEVGMTYKIAPFLVWFHRYSKLAGRMQIPLMGDIIMQHHAERQRLSFLVAFALLVLSVVFPQEILARTAGAAFFLSNIYWFYVLYKTATFQTELKSFEAKAS
ncbi:MAG: hypothetical protein OEZ59_00420 [Deltaproteobacteria bacterium]|nr:hypothetical protein [Deltaproteobacteria bacterium]